MDSKEQYSLGEGLDDPIGLLIFLDSVIQNLILFLLLSCVYMLLG